jgi:hypothetical protein
MSSVKTPTKRRDSGLSFLGKAGKRLSFKNEAEQPPPPPKPVLKEAYFSTYQLSWEKLKAYLERKFPNTEFGDRNVSLFAAGTYPCVRQPCLIVSILMPHLQVNVDKYIFAIPTDAELVSCHFSFLSNMSLLAMCCLSSGFIG